MLKGVDAMLNGSAPSMTGQYIFIAFCCGHPQLHIRLTMPMSLECTDLNIVAGETRDMLSHIP